VTVSSGPGLVARCASLHPRVRKAKTRPLSMSLTTTSSRRDQELQSEPRTTTNSFYSMTASSSDAFPTTTGIVTDETAFEFTSGGSNTEIVRRRFHTGALNQIRTWVIHTMDHTPIAATLPRPLRVLHCPGAQKSGGGPTAGTTRTRTRTYEKENTTTGYAPSQSRSTLSTWTRSRSTTPTPPSSDASLSAPRNC